MPQNRELKRNLLSIERTEEGYTISSPVHRGLVLSGGGAKGVAYAGMIRAMHEQGALESLTHVCGASAGAMTASLLAVGMSSDAIDKLLQEVDIVKLLDARGLSRRALGERFRNILEVIFLVQFKHYLNGVAQPVPDDQKLVHALLSTKIRSYEWMLAKEGIELNSLDDLVKLANNNEHLSALDKAFSSFPKEMKNVPSLELEPPRITFEDVGRLRTLLPDEQKHEIKHLSVAVTNQTHHLLEIYGESHLPQKSIAEMVQISGAHPALFAPRINGNNESFADGGIIDNMPTHVLEKLGINKEEILCVKAESARSYHARVKRARKTAPEHLNRFYGLVDTLSELVLGGRVLQGITDAVNREKVYHFMDNMHFINTGAITTTAMKLSSEQKASVIQSAYAQTKAFLNNRNKLFEHPLLAMLYLGVDKLDEQLTIESSDVEMSTAAINAKGIWLLQKTLVNELQDNDFSGLVSHIGDIENLLVFGNDRNNELKNKALALCIKQIDFLSDGALAHYLTQKVAEETYGKPLGWFEWLLELLLTPIRWVITLWSGPSDEEGVESESTPSVYKRALGFFDETELAPGSASSQCSPAGI